MTIFIKLCRNEHGFYDIVIMFIRSATDGIYHLIGTLKPQSNGPLYNNTVRILTLAVDG